jgi:hypothetical protein
MQTTHDQRSQAQAVQVLVKFLTDAIGFYPRDNSWSCITEVKSSVEPEVVQALNNRALVTAIQAVFEKPDHQARLNEIKDLNGVCKAMVESSKTTGIDLVGQSPNVFGTLFNKRAEFENILNQELSAALRQSENRVSLIFNSSCSRTFAGTWTVVGS